MDAGEHKWAKKLNKSGKGALQKETKVEDKGPGNGQIIKDLCARFGSSDYTCLVNASELKRQPGAITMREALLFFFKFCVATGAAVVAAYYAIAAVEISGLMAADFKAAYVIRERCPVHLVSPGWIVGNDQFDVLNRWVFAEMKARLKAIVLVLWVLAVSALVWGFSRRHAARKSGVV